MRMTLTGLALAGVVSAAAVVAAPVTPEPKKEKMATTPAEKIRQALDKTVSLDMDNGQLPNAIKKISDDIGVPLVIDRFAIQQMGMEPEQLQVHFKGKNVKARTALRSILGQYNLGYAVVGDSVIVTTDEMAMYRQVRQRVNVEIDGMEFAAAVRQLARETGTNLVLDTRAAKEAKGVVTLQLDDVPLETAVRLMAEMVGLKPVRVGNVLFITTKTAANELKADTDLVPPTPGNPRVTLEGLIGPGGIGVVPNVPAMNPTPPPPPTPPAPEPVPPKEKEEVKPPSR